jgi:hypothetical protein
MERLRQNDLRESQEDRGDAERHCLPGADMKKPKPPKTLDAMVDVILAYRPKPKSKPAKRRKRRATKARKENEA